MRHLRPCLPHVALAVIVMIACARDARAYQIFPRESLEWAVADSDVIVVGKIIRNEALPGGTARADGYVVTIRVTRTLKGAAPIPLRVVHDHEWLHVQLQQACRDDRELLFLLVRSERRVWDGASDHQRRVFGASPLALRRDFHVPSVARVDGATDWPTIDLSEVPSGGQLVPFIEAELTRSATDPARGSCELRVSETSTFFRNPGGRCDRHTVPLDRRTEGLAMEWAKSPDPYDRWNAIQVLRGASAPERAAVMSGLLADPFSTEHPWPEPEGLFFRGIGKWRVRQFPIRQAAADALDAWRVPHAPVVPHEPEYGGSPIRRDVLLWSGICVAAAVLVLIVSRLRGRAPYATARNVTTAFCGVLLLAAVACWARGRYRIDDVSFPVGSGRHEIASLGGGIRYLIFDSFEPGFDASYTTVGSTPATLDDWDFGGRESDERTSRIGFVYGSGMLWMSPGPKYRFLIIPWWAICAALGVLPALRLGLMVRRRRRRKRGYCRVCGYDLRATPMRCPECGTGVLAGMKS